MKKFAFVIVLGLAAGATLSAPAFAADMPVKASAIAPVAAYNWTGWYIGAQGGVASGSVKTKAVNSLFWVGNTGPGVVDTDVDGFFGGGQLGYQWDTGSWIFGLEASLVDGDINGSRQSPFFPTDRWGGRMEMLTTVVARIGYAWGANRSVNTYIKGGYAGANVENTITDTVTTIVVPGILACGPATTACHAGTKEWQNGWTIGAGIEGPLWQNVIFGIEYSYVDLGGKAHNNLTGGSSIALESNVSATAHMLGARLSFRFGDMGKGPVVAKY